MTFFIKDFFSKCDQILRTSDFDTFTKEIVNEKHRFLYSELWKIGANKRSWWKYFLSKASGCRLATLLFSRDLFAIFRNSYSDGCLEPSQTSKMKLFLKIVNSFLSLTIFTKSSILYIWLSSEYAFGYAFGIETEAYLKLSQISTMDLFRKKNPS